MRKIFALLAWPAAAALAAPGPAPAPVAAPAAAPATDAPAPGGAFSEENLQFDFALGLLRRNLFSEAQAEFTKFLTAFPASPRAAAAHRYRGEAAYGRHDYAAAAKDYYQYLQTNPPVDLALRQRYAICLYEMKRPADALAVLKPIAPLVAQEENRELRPSVHYYLALAERDLGDAPAAANDFAAVAATPGPTPFTPLALYALGEIHQAQNQHAQAARDFERLIKEYPAHALAPAARLAQSNSLRQSGALAPSIATFRELANSPDAAIRARARYGLAGALAESGKPEEAAASARETLRDPAAKEFHDGAHYLLATIHFAQGRNDEAIAEATAVNPEGSFGENAAVTRAWALYRKGDFAAARGAAEEGAAKRPQNEDFPYLAGRACWELGLYAEAAARFVAARDRALQFKGKRAESAALEAALAWEKATRPAEAATIYEWLRGQFPNGASAADARFGLGRSLMAAGRHEAALPVWEGLSQDPALPAEKRESALFQQAAAYYYLKQYSNLRAACERLLKEFPNGANAPDALYWLAWRDMEDKDYAAALSRYREFGKRHPQHRLAPKARYYVGAALLKLNREDEAAEAFYAIVRAGEALEGRELLWLASRLGEHRDAAKAEEIFGALLQNEKEPMLRAVGLLGRAKLRRATAAWAGAAADSEAALKLLPQLATSATVATALENEANFGLAVALRELGKPETAAAALAKVKVSPDDPFTARLHFEQGRLALARGEHAKASELLLRVGLLVADPEMAGEALWLAAEACERGHDPKRARVCYDELAGTAPGSFGALNPDSPWRKKAQEKLEKLPAKAKQ